jgi:nuclear pore complex protein Nup188
MFVLKLSQCICSLLHSFVVDVLLNSPGHTLLINILGIGVNTVNKLTTSSVNWGQSSLPLESLNICFKVINLLLQNKSSESITPFEQSLASTMVRVAPPSSLSVTSQQHIITSLATYAYHRDDPAIPTSAVQLLTRIAPIATMSMFSCLGNEAVALRDVFVTRLSTKAESTELKIAILDLITVSIGTQPGLLELLLSLEHSQSTDNGKENGGNNVLIVGKDSCLKFILEMISSSSHKTPPSLVSSGMTLLKTLWERRHVGALSALTATDDKFWEHLMAPVYEDMNLESDGDQMALSYKLHVCSEIFNVISMEVYYVIFNRLNGGFKSSIKTFVSKESYKKWCQVYQWCLPEVESQQSVSLTLVKSHHRLAESWRALLLVAISCHESLFGLENGGTKKVILQELLESMEALTNHLPLTLPVLNELLSLYLCLLRKWTNVNIPCNVIERFSVMMDRLIHIDNQIGSWQTLPLVYSCLICIVTSLRRNEIDLERRFTQGLVPLIATTLTNYSQYLPLTSIKYCPETYSVYLLSEIMFTLENDHGWFRTLRDHSIVMILIQLCTGHIESLTHSGFVSACFSFFLTLSQLEKGAEVLMANDIFHMLSISLCIVVDALTPNIKNEEDPLKLSDLLPHPQWYNVWLAAIKLVTSLLCTKKHYVINDVINFVSAHSDRLLWVLDILVAVKYMEVLEESNCVCQFFKQLVIYRLQWRGSLFHQHNIAIERVLLLFHGAVTLLSRERVKDIVKTMDSQGFLSSNLSCKKTKSDNEVWIKQSPAYLQIKEKLFSIVTSCLVILNGYTPPLVDLFMCSLTSPLDLSEWPRLFQLVSTLPVLDLTCSPSISTLTNALSVGREILVKLNHPRSSGSNPSPFKSPPIKSPITPGLPRPHSAASQQKRNEILFMLEQTVLLLISQSLCYLYNEQVEVIEKQALKKQLVGELGSFCQVLLINFQRKGAPSPRSSSLSSSHQTLYESSSGRGSSHSFSESSEQGLFKIAELFYKSKILAR